MKPASRRTTLEPVGPALLAVTLAHLALALLVIGWAWQPSDSTASGTTRTGLVPAELHWFSPSDFSALTTQKSANAVIPPKATTLPRVPSPFVAQPPRPAGRGSSRYITFSRWGMPGTSELARQQAEQQFLKNPSGTAVSAQAKTAEVSGEGDALEVLDRIDEALHQLFMLVWEPPDPRWLPPSRRSVQLDLSIGPEISIDSHDLAVPSGAPDLDLSVLNALAKAKMLLPDLRSGRHAIKIPAALPSSFPKSRYDCRIQFQIE